MKSPTYDTQARERGGASECVGKCSATPLWPLVARSTAEAAYSKQGATVCALLVFAFCVPPFALAQFALDWWTIDGGGGTSTGGGYVVTGTLGQPDAGSVLSGGDFTLTGGFWSVIAAVQTPGAPDLIVVRTATNTVVVSWPLAGAEGWVLQATNALPSVAAPWPLIPPPYQTNGPILQFIEPTPVGNRFYRLHKP